MYFITLKPQKLITSLNNIYLCACLLFACACGDGDGAWGGGGLDDEDELAVEEVHGVACETLKRCGIAVAQTAEGACSSDGKLYSVVGIWTEGAARIDEADGDEREVVAIGSECGAVGLECEARGAACGAEGALHGSSALGVVGYGTEGAWGVVDAIPNEAVAAQELGRLGLGLELVGWTGGYGVGLLMLTAEAASVEAEFDLGVVGLDHDGTGLTFAPVPVGKDMEGVVGLVPL